MKKFFLSIIIVAFCSCTTDILLVGDSQEKSFNDNISKTYTEILPKEDCSFNVSLTVAKFAAEKVLAQERKLIDFSSFSFEKDTLFYIANYDKGYKIISADSRTSAVLMSSDEGRFVLDDKTDGTFNASMLWLDIVSSDIYALKHGYAKSDNYKNVDFWDSLSDNVMRTQIDSIDFEDGQTYWVRMLESDRTYDYHGQNVEHLIQTKWGQRSPWNTKVPDALSGNDSHCPTGCSAVAVAQILYFTHENLNKPLWLNHDAMWSGVSNGSNYYNYSFDSGTYVSNSSRWSMMPLFSTGNHTDYVASLMADVGSVLEMEYAPDGSGAFVDVEDMNHYGILCNKTEYDRNIVSSNISLGKPVIITAYADKSTILGFNVYSGGHTWIIDGMHTDVTEYVKTYVWRPVSEVDVLPQNPILYSEDEAKALVPDLYSGKTEVESHCVYSYSYRMNWGWSGSLYDNMLFGDTSVWEVNVNNNIRKYQYNKSIIYNIN